MDAPGAARAEHAPDIFDEDPPGPGLDDGSAGWGPEVAFILGAKLVSGFGVGLARDAAKEAIHEATPWLAAEGSGICPHRRRSQESLPHRLHQNSAGIGFPLHHADRSSAWNCQLDGEIEASASGAEGDAVEGVGTEIHMGLLGVAAGDRLIVIEAARAG